MKHSVKVTVLDKKLYPELQEQYLADPASGACPCFEVGDEFLFERADGHDDFWHFGRDRDPKFPCAEAWDCISRYIYTGLQGGAIMHGWTNDDRIMIACCNDGTRPVVFKIERFDEAETDDERDYLARHDFRIGADAAYTGARDEAETAPSSASNTQVLKAAQEAFTGAAEEAGLETIDDVVELTKGCTAAPQDSN